MKNKKLKIINRNGVELSTTIDLPVDQRPIGFAIFAHCFTCTSNLSAVRNIAQSLTQKGFGVVRFDFTGLGKSEGDFADSHFVANILDLEDVNKYISENYEPPILVIGHSLGGAAAIVAASRLENIKAVATIGAPSSSEHTAHHFLGQFDASPKNEGVEVNIGGRPFSINKNFVEQFKEVDVHQILKNLKKPLLILHAPFDKVVGVENAQEIFKNAFHPKSFISLDDADHLLSNANDSLYAGSVIAAWVQRYFSKPEEIELDTEGHQIVGHLDLVEDNFTTTLQTKSHSFIADEPKKVGGDNLGPAPFDLINAGLAACTVMTLKMYAARKEWDLKEAYAYVSHSKVKDENGDIIDQFDKKLKLIGDLDEKQKTRLKQIAAKCPVHKTLETPGAIATEIVN